MKRIVTTIMTIAMVITTIAPTTVVKAESVQEEYVDIVNPALIGMKTVRGPKKLYSPNNYFQNLAAKNLYPPMPGEQYQDTNPKSDYPEEKTYYYITSKFDQNKLNIDDPEEIAKLKNSEFSSTEYDDIAKLDEAKQTVSYRFFKEYLADDKCTVWDKVVSQVALGVENKNDIIDLYTQTNLAGFCNIYEPTKTYYYTAFTCKHSNCGYDSDTDPYGYHIIHTFLTLYDFYADHDSSVSDITTYTPYTDAGQGWFSRSPIYTHIKDFDHPTEVEPLNNYYYIRSTNYYGQDLNYVIPKRAYLASTEVYKGEPRCPEAYESVKYRQENPLESLSPAPSNVPTSTTPEVVNVESVSLSTSSITMNVGDTKAISYVVAPSDATNKEVGWTSSNKSIAYYKDGSIIAKNAGVATITVTTKSGNRKASVVVNVVGKTEDVVEDSDDYNVDTKTNTATCDKVLVRNGVATIPDMVVVNGKKVKVTSVSSKAFKNPASVTTIVFGKNVTLVSGSFAKFKNLRSVTFKSTKVKVGKNSFKTCKKLKTIKFTNKKLTKVTLGKNAFSKKTKIRIQCKSKSAKKAIKKTFRGYKYKI